MYIHSQEIGELIKALIKAQSEMPAAKKNAENSFYDGSKYADLNSCLEACMPTLNANGLSLQLPCTDYDWEHGNVEITAILAHESGQWQVTNCRFPMKKNDIQAEGGAITYGRRYSLAALLGLPQIDKDGNDNVNVIENKDGICCVSKEGIIYPVRNMKEKLLENILANRAYEAAWPAAKERLEYLHHLDEIMEKADELKKKEETNKTGA